MAPSSSHQRTATLGSKCKFEDALLSSGLNQSPEQCNSSRKMVLEEDGLRLLLREFVVFPCS